MLNNNRAGIYYMQPTIREVILDLINKPSPRSHSNQSNQLTIDDAIIAQAINPLPMVPS
jgi:hypothetical protein